MPETGHTPLLPADEQVVTLPMDNGWSKALLVGKLPEGDERPVVVDMDPTEDPVPPTVSFYHDDSPSTKRSVSLTRTSLAEPAPCGQAFTHRLPWNPYAPMA